MAVLPKVLFASMELEMVVLVFQKINIFLIGDTSKGRKSGPVHPSRVTLMNLAWDFVRLFLYSDSIEDFLLILCWLVYLN